MMHARLQLVILLCGRPAGRRLPGMHDTGQPTISQVAVCIYFQADNHRSSCILCLYIQNITQDFLKSIGQLITSVFFLRGTNY